MPTITPITDAYAVTGQLAASDFADAAAAGFRSVINFRPDGETGDQLASDTAARLARAAGLRYAAVPTSKFDMFAADLVTRAEAAFADLPAPVLAYCASGQRAAIVWAAARARATPVDVVLAALKDAGFALDFLRDDLELQADRAQWATPPTGSQTVDGSKTVEPSPTRVAA